MKNLISKITLIAFLITCVAGIFSGCTNQEYGYTQEDIVSMVNSAFDADPKLLSISKGRDDNGKITRYVFKTDKDIEFSVIVHDAPTRLFSIETATLECNYIESVYNYLESEILKLNEKYELDFHSEFSDNGGCMDSYIIVSDFDELEKIVDYICEFKEIVKDYIPKYDSDTALFSKYADDEYFMGDFEPIISSKSNFNFTAAAKGVELIDVTLTENEFDKETVLKYAQITYAELYRAEDSENEVYKNLPWKNIRTLYINGTKYESRLFPPRFVYNEKDSQYYTAVDNVMDFTSYNSKVDYHMNMYIIEHYLDGKYERNHTENSSRYVLNGNKYVIRVPQENPERAEFFKNNEKIDIEMISENDFWRSEHYEEVFRVITLSDYAELLECTFEIDQSEGAIYLTSK